MRVSIVVAADERELIGAGGDLPWRLSEDLKRFRRLTTGHTVVVGRLTQDSIVRRLGHGLPDRHTVVVTRQSRPDDPATSYRGSVAAALGRARELEREEVFVIGGAEIYRQALPEVTTVHLTRVRGTHAGDTYLPDSWLDGFVRTEHEAHDGYAFEIWERVGS